MLSFLAISSEILDIYSTICYLPSTHRITLHMEITAEDRGKGSRTGRSARAGAEAHGRGKPRPYNMITRCRVGIEEKRLVADGAARRTQTRGPRQRTAAWQSRNRHRRETAGVYLRRADLQ